VRLISCGRGNDADTLSLSVICYLGQFGMAIAWQICTCKSWG